jgi:hypothetical protein
MDLGEIRIDGRNGFGWFRIGSSGGLLWERWWTFVFHKESRLLFVKLIDYQFSRNILHHGVSEWVSK